LGYINQVRNRAANPATFVKNKKTGLDEANYVISPYPAFADKAEAIKAVRLERMLELATEGHRFFDLVRWGIAAKALNPYLAYEGKILVTMFGGSKFTTGREFLPIPQAQIDITGSTILKQNPSY
jgi:hypothetical protein